MPDPTQEKSLNPKPPVDSPPVFPTEPARVTAVGENEKPVRRETWLLGLLLVVLVVLTYLPALRGEFIWDDDDHFTQNPCVVGPKGLKEIWTTRAARICPLVLSSFHLEYALWGANPAPFHLVNILLHGLSAWVLWRVLTRLKAPGAWLGAALWALHPVQVESVAWITELKNVQSGLFYLLTIWCFTGWIAARNSGEKSGLGHYAMAVLCGMLAMSSKSSTVVLPLVLGLVVWWLEGRWKWRNLAWLLPFVVLAIATGILALWTQHLEGANDYTSYRSLADRLLVSGKVFWFYLMKLAWPNPLIFIYPRWKFEAGSLTEWIPTLSALAAMAVFYFQRKSWGGPLYFVTAYFVAALLPVLGILNHYFLRFSFVGDHFQYLASIGPLAMVGVMVAKITSSPGWTMRNLGWLPGCGLLLAVITLSWQHQKNFHSSESLWSDTLVKNPDCWMAHHNLGLELNDKGRLAEAIVHYKSALQIKPDNAKAQNNWGSSLLSLGRAEEAIQHFESAIKINYYFPGAHTNLGKALHSLGRTDEAIKHYEIALKIKPDFAEAHMNWGLALQDKGQSELAIEHYQLALRIDPDGATSYYNHGNALAAQGRNSEARGHYELALRLATAQNNLQVKSKTEAKLSMLPSEKSP